MKKLFLLIPALALTLLANAAVINIDNTTANAVQAALNSAASGDIIEMAAGTYEESGNYLAFTGKELTVRAAEGAEVIIRTVCPVRLKEGAKAEFINVKFDCSTIGSYDYVIVAADDTDNKRVVLTGCEFYGWEKNKAMIEATSSRRLAAITIDKCYFHDCMKSVVFVENTGSIDLSITNSTFANIATNTESFSAGVIDSRATAGSFLVDHCTFYNVQAMNTDYAAIGKVATPGAVVSNCIFALPTSTDNQRAIRDVAQANNCLTFNYLKDSGRGIHGDVARNNCIFADPLFTDAANGDYSFAGNWVTMDLSPARGAATNGSDLGDPRWYSAEVLPSTDFASPYQFVGAKAQIAGNLWYDDVNGYLYYNDKSECGVATWKINATRACVLAATLNMNAATTTGHKFKVEVLDAEGNSIAETAEPSSKSDAGNIALPDQITLPAAGNYTVKLYNLTAWSSAIIDGITLAYVGGDVQAMPGTTNIADAWFSSNGTRANGKISYSSVSSGCWAKWNINVASAGAYKLTVNISGQYGHEFTVEFLKEGSETPINIAENGTVYGNDETLYANEMGSVVLEAANYEMKVSNSVGDAAIHSVKLEYAGGAVITIPAEELIGNEAVLVDAGSLEVSKLANGNLKYGDNGTPLGEYVYWNIHATKSGLMNVIANVVYDTDKEDAAHQSSHQFLVELFSDLSATALATSAEASANNHTGEISLPAIEIPAAGDYFVKLTNQKQWSSAILHSLEFEYVGGDRATLPAAFDFSDALLSAKAQIYNNMLYFEEPGDHNPVGQWAKWNVKVAEAGTFLFTMNVTSSNGQSYKISILDGETVVDAFESGSLGAGDKTAKHYFNLVTGNYTVKLENMTAWSQGHIVSLVVTQPELLTIDEAAEDNSIIVANYQGGEKDIQIIRTIVAGMYNTICLPFSVGSSQLQAVFGNDVELKQMSSAELSGDVLNLMFDDATSIYHGTPYLIKTSNDVVNPIFTNVEIRSKAGDATSGTNADFIGTLIKGEVPAGENNLFLGQENLLYFSQTATPIKGMRAYFQVHGVANPSNAIKRARIVMNSQVATDIEMVNSQESKAKSQKLMENGQLVIIRDGVRYNIMGAKLQ